MAQGYGEFIFEGIDRNSEQYAWLQKELASPLVPQGPFFAGANVKGVQRMLGHASAAMTLDVHSGLFDDDLDAVADRMDAAAAAAPRACPERTVSALEESRATS